MPKNAATLTRATFKARYVEPQTSQVAARHSSKRPERGEDGAAVEARVLMVEDRFGSGRASIV
jgi:hypothetical protein